MSAAFLASSPPIPTSEDDSPRTKAITPVHSPFPSPLQRRTRTSSSSSSSSSPYSSSLKLVSVNRLSASAPQLFPDEIVPPSPQQKANSSNSRSNAAFDVLEEKEEGSTATTPSRSVQFKVGDIRDKRCHRPAAVAPLITNIIDLEFMAAEVPYCIDRVHGVLLYLIEKQLGDCLFSYGSCMVYLTSFMARLAHHHPSVLHREHAGATVKNVTAIALDWANWVKVGPVIDVAEGAKGLDVIPGITVPARMLKAVRDCPDMREWEERYNRNKQSRWSDLTMIVTLQWSIEPKSTGLLRFCVEEVVRDLAPAKIDWRKKGAKKNVLLTHGSEHRIYCMTHVVLVLSEFGSYRIFLEHASVEELRVMARALSGWLLFLHRAYPASHVYNREIVTEIACSLLILKQNGIELDDDTLKAMVDTTTILVEAGRSRSQLSNLRQAPAIDRQNVYVQAIVNDQPRGDKGGLFVNYHTHFLVGLLFQLCVIDTIGGPCIAMTEEEERKRTTNFAGRTARRLKQTVLDQFSVKKSDKEHTHKGKGGQTKNTTKEDAVTEKDADRKAKPAAKLARQQSISSRKEKVTKGGPHNDNTYKKRNGGDDDGDEKAAIGALGTHSAITLTPKKYKKKLQLQHQEETKMEREMQKKGKEDNSTKEGESEESAVGPPSASQLSVTDEEEKDATNSSKGAEVRDAAEAFLRHGGSVVGKKPRAKPEPTVLRKKTSRKNLFGK